MAAQLHLREITRGTRQIDRYLDAPYILLCKVSTSCGVRATTCILKEGCHMISDLIGASSESQSFDKSVPHSFPFSHPLVRESMVQGFASSSTTFPVSCSAALHKKPAIAHPPAIAHSIVAPLRIVTWTCRFFVSNLPSQHFFPFRVGPAPHRRNTRLRSICALSILGTLNLTPDSLTSPVMPSRIQRVAYI